MANDYCKLRYKKQIEKQNNNKIKHNHQLTHQVKTTNVRKFPNRNSQNDSSNKLNASSTGYKPINNNKELVEPQKEILNLHIQQDELIKEGIKIEKSVESIKLKIRELTNKFLEMPM